MKRSVARRATRSVVMIGFLLVLLDLILSVLPFGIFYRSYTRHVFVDVDIIYDVPKEVSWAQAGDQVSEERLCLYWTGTGTAAFPAHGSKPCDWLIGKSVKLF